MKRLKAIGAWHGRKPAKASIRDTPDRGMILRKVSWIDLERHEERNMERNSRKRSLKRRMEGQQGWLAGMVAGMV